MHPFVRSRWRFEIPEGDLFRVGLSQGIDEAMEGSKVPAVGALDGLFDPMVARDDHRVGRAHVGDTRVGGGCSGFQYGMMIEENGQNASDQVFESHGIKLFVDPISLQYLKNADVDFVDTVTGGGFTIKNPNATSTCGCGSSFSAQ